MRRIFVTGIGTGVGKTVVSAILAEALDADYWKPIQAGDLDNSDTENVRRLVSNSKSFLHPELYRLTQPMSPHAAAAVDGITIELDAISKSIPFTLGRDLIIEGAGGIMSPVNDSALMIDMIAALGAEAIIVSRNYLGSINHTLLTVEALKRRGLPINGIIFNGGPVQSSTDFITRFSGIRPIGFIYEERIIDRQMVARYAQALRREFRR